MSNEIRTGVGTGFPLSDLQENTKIVQDNTKQTKRLEVVITVLSLILFFMCAVFITLFMLVFSSTR